ncbi:unnamed protein product [Miscanthus lutarioriparius]|uniref:GDSL esterase/lipase n=2 Tax=Miscanthus lutarioriparius TaxID=422564 RepID=A0A811S9U3_9POAL|nr:unnamed protein product [Miscanthus lutarioriparius]
MRPVVCLVMVLSMDVLGAAAGVFKPPPAMYVLGDSTLDVGNNNYLPGANVPRANRRYYGIDFPGGVSTGRFSNGYNTADFIAKCIGFVSSPPSYLSLVAPASSGGLLNAGSTIPLSKQVQYFNATRSKMIVAAAAGSSNAVDTLINRSFFLLLFGGNDVFAFANAEQARNRSGAADLQSDAAAFYGSLVSNYSAAIRGLYALGARRLAIVNVGLAGCLPVARVLDATGACAEDRNRLAAGFNAALRSLLDDLASSSSGLPGLAYSLADSLGLMADTFADPLASGFTDVADACCGGGRLGAEAACTPNATLCADRGQYYFWDNIHPTERAAALRAQAFYDGPAQYTTPINFKQLVHMS